MNYRFNIDEWLPRFPLKPKGHFEGMFVSSPSQICNNEQLRRAAHDQYDWGPEVPMDVFILAEGEPHDRNVTKIGGLPYRPAKIEWPRDADGKPLTFLAQFDFTDSADIIENVPGDVLLIFTPDNDNEGPVVSLQFEWYGLGMTDLIAAADVPEQRWQFKPCYGYRHRTVSYPEARRKPEFAANESPKVQGVAIDTDYRLLQFQATQIGKAPFFIQPDDVPLPGQILCTVSEVCVAPNIPFPWINRPDPMTREELRGIDYLTMGDAGCIYISIDETGNLHFNESCY